MKALQIRVGCAGWTIPKPYADRFPADGSHLERYAVRFSAVEIDSSFYKSHKPTTYTRWAASVLKHFRFAIKIPKEITHVRRLADVGTLERFLSEVSGLGAKLGTLVAQLPPSLAFNAKLVGKFLTELREHTNADVVCEPRHASWFTDEVDRLLVKFRVARITADPVVVPRAAEPGGWDGLVYYRLHGSPRMYYSAYSEEYFDALAKRLVARSSQVWCIFDNTALGAATMNALDVMKRLQNGVSICQPQRTQEK